MSGSTLTPNSHTFSHLKAGLPLSCSTPVVKEPAAAGALCACSLGHQTGLDTKWYLGKWPSHSLTVEGGAVL